MNKKDQAHFTCPICNLEKPLIESRNAQLITSSVADLIKREHADWDQEHYICLGCLNRFRTEYVEDALEQQKGDLTSLESSVLKSMLDSEILARNINPEFEKALSIGDRLSDNVAKFGGSWRFIIFFGTVLLVWILANSYVLLKRPFDPYPFILLNLLLSCLAAIQAPVIMMSQNRQEAKDRLRAEHDYQVNLKAEIEIRQLHIKIDQLMNHFWHRLLEIQHVQTELLEDLAKKDNSH
jgi:uncharacterized membrane protein